MGVVLICGLWVAGLLLAPLPSTGRHRLRPMLAAGVYSAGALVCHQRSERSFHLAGAQLPVCARCLGLYVGGLVGAIGWVFAAGTRATRAEGVRRILEPRRLRAVLVIAAAPTLLTVLTAQLGVWDPANALRAMLALPLGIVIGGLVSAFASRDLR